MSRLTIAIIACLLAACTDIDRTPDRWVTVRDARNGQPVPGVPLVYHKIRKPYLVAGQLLTSREYTSNAQGRTHVPSGVFLQPALGSPWMRTMERDHGRSHREILLDDTLYVRERPPQH